MPINQETLRLGASLARKHGARIASGSFMRQGSFQPRPDASSARSSIIFNTLDRANSARHAMELHAKKHDIHWMVYQEKKFELPQQRFFVWHVTTIAKGKPAIGRLAAFMTGVKRVTQRKR